MKKRTWILSALMYVLVLAACFGVLSVMHELIRPNRAGTEAGAGRVPEETESGQTAEVPDEAKNSGEGAERRIRHYTEALGPERPEPKLQRETVWRGWKTTIPYLWTPEPEKPYVPPKLILATDVHYMSASTWEDGPAFQDFINNCDGKVARYEPELLEAFLDEVIELHPTALVLSGDLTMNGEKVNHQELADRLKRVQEAGIPVLVIPGNHDINKPEAATYFGAEKEAAEQVTPQEFYEIYHTYGYDQALSRDPASLSYVYPLDEKNWLLMLDSAQYEPVNLVEGRIRDATLSWMEEQLEAAKEQGIFVLPVAHHNLLPQSRMYTTQCVLENSDQVIELLQSYQLPLYLSGHLHVQRIRRHKSEPGVPDSAYGIEEIITDSLAIPPCQYGVLEWMPDGSAVYATHQVDVSAWAKRNGSTNEDLLSFEAWSNEYIQQIITTQIRYVLKNLGSDVEQSMARVYASVYIDYYAGRRIDAKGVRSSRGYQWWQRNMPDSKLLQELNAMIEDSDRDNNYRLLPEWEARYQDSIRSTILP